MEKWGALKQTHETLCILKKLLRHLVINFNMHILKGVFRGNFSRGRVFELSSAYLDFALKWEECVSYRKGAQSMYCLSGKKTAELGASNNSVLLEDYRPCAWKDTRSSS